MSADSAVNDLADWADVTEMVAGLQSGQHDIEQLIEQLLEECAAAQTCLTQSEAELATSRRQLAEAQAQLAETRNRLQAAGPVDATTHAVLNQMEQERRTLEIELENVRLRAEELAHNLADQKRQTVEERAQWTAELRQMRRALEKQAEAAPRPAPVAEPPRPKEARESQPAGDPVISSVMAQFELLQKDQNRRRAQANRQPAK